MKRKVWIIGPVAIDRVAYVDQLPTQGSFTRPSRIVERIGGSSGNVALALAETGVETGFISYVGDDENGKKIQRRFAESQITDLHLQHVVGESNSALVMVDQSGDRTIIALTESHLAQISLEAINFSENDIVVFSLWRPFFLDHLNYVKKLGCMVVVGLEALSDPDVSGADFAIGSEAELNGVHPSERLEKFPTIVITRGAAGIDQYQSSGMVHQASVASQVIDATGAGDSFLAGYLTHLAGDRPDLAAALLYGARWAAASIALEGSEPAKPPL
ncbi:RbsK Sugar kinases, ribokinase family [Candidatus Nanopelagicaceae bacterium]